MNVLTNNENVNAFVKDNYDTINGVLCNNENITDFMTVGRIRGH